MRTCDDQLRETINDDGKTSFVYLGPVDADIFGKSFRYIFALIISSVC